MNPKTPNPMTILSPEDIAWVRASCPTLKEPHRPTQALLKALKLKAEIEQRQNPTTPSPTKASSQEP